MYLWKVICCQGIDFPEELGGNCVEITRRLIRVLESEGITYRILSAEEDTHFAVIARPENEWIYLDPSLGQIEPASIEEIFGGNSVAISAYPKHRNRTSIITLRPTETDQVIGIQRRTVNSAGVEKLVLNDRYDLRKDHDLPNADDLDIAGLEQDMLTLRLIRDGEEFRLRRRTYKREYSARRMGSRPTEQKWDGQTYNSKFHTIVERMAYEFGQNSAQLLSFFEQASELYFEVRKEWQADFESRSNARS